MLARRMARRGPGQLPGACVAASDLRNLLRSSGHLEEALRVAEEKARLHAAGLGWGRGQQLLDETRHLQVLVALGHYDEVLAAVEACDRR